MEKMNLILMKLDEMNGKIDRLGERMDRLEERMDRLEERMDRLEERVIQLELKAVEQERWNRKIEAQITKIEMSIEMNCFTVSMQLEMVISIWVENWTMRLRVRLGENTFRFACCTLKVKFAVLKKTVRSVLEGETVISSK